MLTLTKHRRKAGAGTRHTAKRTQFSTVCERLEDRQLLSTLDLTGTTHQGILNNAMFRLIDTQPAGSGMLQSFVRLQASPTEQGYNTGGSIASQHDLKSASALQLSQVSTSVIDGVKYRQFILDANQVGNGPISLDRVQIALNTSGNLTNQATIFANPIYDSGADNWIKLNASGGSGEADLLIDIPDSNFGSAVPGTYVYLYSHFGTNVSSNDGYEEWAIPASLNSPVLTTTAGSGSLGSTLKDTATLASGVNETGLLTFALHDPSGSVVYTNVVTVNGNGTYYSDGAGTKTGSAIATSAGNYNWTAIYSGDLSNNSAVDQGGSAEKTTITTASPTLTTTASGGGVYGSAVPADTATLAGTYNPTGNIIFNLEDASNHVVYSQTDTVTGNGTYTANVGDLVLNAGTYHWVTNYSGDANNNGTGYFTSDSERVVIDPFTPIVIATIDNWIYGAYHEPPTGTVTGVGSADLGPPTSYTYYAGGTPLNGEPVNVGYDYAVVAHYASTNPNYTNADSASAPFNITPAPLTITADSTTKTYGDTVAFTGTEFTTDGLVNSDTVSSVTLVSDGAAATAPVAGSPYAITANDAVGCGLDNYAINYVDGKLAVTAKALTVTADSTSKTYGDTVAFTATEFTTDGLVNSDSVDFVVLASDGAAATSSVAGSPYAIVASDAVGSGLDNYAINYVDGKLTVAARPITVTADAKTKVAGTADPALTYQVTVGSLVNGDTLTGALTRDAGESVGLYAIRQGGLTASSNYALTYVGNSLILTAAAKSDPFIHTSIITTGGESVDPNFAYVTALYRDVLHRAPDAGGLDYWLHSLSAGSSAGAVAAGIWNSAERRSLGGSNADFVTDLYDAVLRRAPDAVGFNFWVGRLNGGASLASVADNIWQSPEHRSLPPIQNPTTLNDTVTILGGNCPTGAVLFTLYNPSGGVAYQESVNINGAGTYRTRNGFQTTAPGTWNWLAQYAGDSNNNSVASAYGSEPAVVGASVDPSPPVVVLPPPAPAPVVGNPFIIALYQNMLHRTPDAGGLAHWTARLAQVGPHSVGEAIWLSPEHQNLVRMGLADGSIAARTAAYRFALKLL